MKASCGRQWWEKNLRRYSLHNRPSLPYIDLVARRARLGEEAAVEELCAMLAPLAEGFCAKFGSLAMRRGLERENERQSDQIRLLARESSEYDRNWTDAANEAERLRAALEAARHELTTLHGLYAHDGVPGETWRLDASRILAKIDAVLEEA
jgi:hypothetical protein